MTVFSSGYVSRFLPEIHFSAVKYIWRGEIVDDCLVLHVLQGVGRIFKPLDECFATFEDAEKGHVI